MHVLREQWPAACPSTCLSQPTDRLSATRRVAKNRRVNTELVLLQLGYPGRARTCPITDASYEVFPLRSIGLESEMQ